MSSRLSGVMSATHTPSCTRSLARTNSWRSSISSDVNPSSRLLLLTVAPKDTRRASRVKLFRSSAPSSPTREYRPDLLVLLRRTAALICQRDHVVYERCATGGQAIDHLAIIS